MIDHLTTKNEEIVIFGTGSLSRKLIEHVLNDFNILYVVDNNRSVWSEYFYGFQIHDPGVLIGNSFDGMIVVASAYFNEIAQQLYNMGYRNQTKIINGKQLWDSWNLEVMKRNLIKYGKSEEVKIVIGASGIYQDGWFATEKELLNLLEAADWRTYFEEGSVAAILAEHVWEHLTYEQALLAARHCYKYLKRGGYLRVAVPDGFHPDSDYIEYVKPGGRGPGADDHKILYTYKSFSEIFIQSNFKVKLLEYFDENNHFHYEHWDPTQGKIRRSSRFDQRNKEGRLVYTSLILDAIKG